MTTSEELDCGYGRCPYYGIVDDPACLECLDDPRRDVTNVPLQGDTTVDDIIQLSVAALQHCLREQGLIAQVVMQVHDGLVLRVRKNTTVEKEKPSMKIYKGTRRGSTAAHPASVRVELEDGSSYPLRWRLDLRNHSPTGLNWGYGGSGPSQCALAVLADYFGDDQAALRVYQGFKSAVIGMLRIDEPWELTSEQIDQALAKITLAEYTPYSATKGKAHESRET